MNALASRVSKALRLPLLALATVGVGYLAWIGFDGTIAGFESVQLPVLVGRDLGERVLVVAPHPDDEALAAGGLIRRSIAEHRRVMVVVVTCGDGFRRIARGYLAGAESPYLRLGEVRAAESRAALADLGLPAEDLVFLGYPDGSMAKMWNDDWSSRPTTGTNGHASVPYSFACRPGAPYRGSSVASDLASIVASFAPTAVVLPDSEDSNADHWAVNAFTAYALDRAGYAGSRYSYLVHRGHFPFPWSFLPSACMEPPRALRRIGVEWLAYPLGRSDEGDKERALDQYRSQLRAMEPFLSAFVRRNELFARGARPIRPVRALPSLDASAMPGVVVQDPSADTLLRAVDPGADLRRVSLVRDGDDFWLGMEARAAVAPGVTYRVSSRLLRNDGAVSRIDVEVRGRRATVATLGPDSVRLAQPLDLRVRGARIWIRIPASAFDGSFEAMVAAESYQGGMVLDRTAYRAVLLR